MEYHNYYLTQLYPLQDKFLKFLNNNEMTFHDGGLNRFSLFSCVANEKNILSNKIACVNRCEVKDIADIWILAKRLSFSWHDIIEITNKKSPVDPIEISKIIKTFPREELKFIRWASNTNLDEIYSDIQIIAEDILLGHRNSLKN